MRPAHIVLFGTAVLLVSLLIQFIHPANGIKITKNFRLYFPSVQDIFSPQNHEDKARIQAILMEEILADSGSAQEQNQYDSTRMAFVRDSIRSAQLAIYYPGNDKSLLYRFFRALDQSKHAKRPIHIVHYGDSQIEGDRITSYLRYRLQKQFGGSGPGWLPVAPLAYPRSMILSHSDNWKSYHFYNRGDSLVSHRMFGHLGIFSRFVPYPADSAAKDSLTQTAWVSYKASSRSYANTRLFKDVRIFYGNNAQPVKFELVYKDSVMMDITLPPGTIPQVVRYTFNEHVNQVTFQFSGPDSPDVYGVSLDGTQGVMVHNVALRGDSGANFTSLEIESFKIAFGEFNIPLFVLQFGGNAVPYATTENRIKAYASNFRRNIQLLKRLEPESSVIVIGPSDMSVLEGTNWITYPQLPSLRDALKNATLEAGAAYWDLYEAMGGQGSMKEWVNTDPPLAIKDYAHFTDKGALKVSQWFTEALLKDYQEYKQRKESDSQTPD